MTSRGGRTSKLHGLTDQEGRPRVLLISAGDINGRGYDTTAIRAAVARVGAQAVIPSTTARRAPIPYDKAACRARNQVERLWCRRLATRRHLLRQARRQLSRRSAATLTY